MKVDLHCHTDASDGVLTPLDLLSRARANSVDLLAITDHDTVKGLQLLTKLDTGPVRLINGIEFSCHWQNKEIHVVGLNFELEEPKLVKFIQSQQELRKQRAIRIGEKLEKIGYINTYSAACINGKTESPGRPHFAEVLVQMGVVSNQKKAFQRFLGDGKSGHCKHEWPNVSEIIQRIHAAGGKTVLAHPARYQISDRQLEQMISDFAHLGGDAIEVISGRQNPLVTQKLAKLSIRHQLSASVGSDFHRPGQPWADLGCCVPLPSQCTSIWADWIA